MDANERFELMAEDFYNKTGMLAPGKDSPAGFYVDSEKLAAEWFKFCSEYNDRVFSVHYEMREMLESVSGELAMLIDEVNDQRLSRVNSQTETPPDLHDQETLHLIQLLLAKARGE